MWDCMFDAWWEGGGLRACSVRMCFVLRACGWWLSVYEYKHHVNG
jgi:hypothetical protein